MRFVTRWVTAALGTATLAVIACSSSSGGGGYSITNCPSESLPASCTSCIESQCSSLLNAVNSACSSFYDCVCPTGADGGNCTESDSCMNALAQGMSQCTACDTQCGSSMTVTSGSSSGGSSGSSGSGSGGVSGH